MKLTEGTKYRLVFKQQSGNYRWYRWEMVATYLGESAQGELIFNLRPAAGTTSISRREDLLFAQTTDMPHTVPRRLKGALPS